MPLFDILYRLPLPGPTGLYMPTPTRIHSPRSIRELKFCIIHMRHGTGDSRAWLGKGPHDCDDV